MDNSQLIYIGMVNTLHLTFGKECTFLIIAYKWGEEHLNKGEWEAMHCDHYERSAGFSVTYSKAEGKCLRLKGPWTIAVGEAFWKASEEVHLGSQYSGIC